MNRGKVEDSSPPLPRPSTHPNLSFSSSLLQIQLESSPLSRIVCKIESLRRAAQEETIAKSLTKPHVPDDQFFNMYDESIKAIILTGDVMTTRACGLRLALASHRLAC